jgi:hypothetical protein
MPTRPINDLGFVRLLAPAFLAAVGTVALVPALVNSTEPPPAEDLVRTGLILSWRLETDGTLFLEVESAGVTSDGAGKDPKDAPVLWFRTPPERDQVPSFAELALEIALASTPPGHDRVPITATAKLERALSGATPSEALPLVALSSP